MQLPTLPEYIGWLQILIGSVLLTFSFMWLFTSIISLLFIYLYALLPFGFLARKVLNYLDFQSFDYERTWWLIQKRTPALQFDIYALIAIFACCHLKPFIDSAFVQDNYRLLVSINLIIFIYYITTSLLFRSTRGVALSEVFCVMFCRSLVVLLSFFLFCPLYFCPSSLYVYWSWLPLWYLKTCHPINNILKYMNCSCVNNSFPNFTYNIHFVIHTFC